MSELEKLLNIKDVYINNNKKNILIINIKKSNLIIFNLFFLNKKISKSKKKKF